MKFRLTYAIIGVIILALVGFIVWSNWAELDQVTRAPGRVVPFARVQIVQSEESGAISAIYVREGDRVEKGELLVKLGTVKLVAAVEEARANVAALESRMARVDAELFDRPLRFPTSLDTYPNFQANQRQLFSRRRAALNSELASLREIAQLQEEEMELNEPLVETGDVARSEIIRMRRAMVETQGKMSNLRSRYIQDLQIEFTRTEEELITARQMRTQREDSLRAASLVAPADGIVKNVRFTTVGGVLRAGDEVLQIVPTGEKLIVEGQVPPRDIAFVKVGQNARVNFDAYDSAIYGSGDGTVVYVSPDTLSEEREGSGTNTYYRVNLEVDIASMRPRRADEAINLQPGMMATAEILTGSSTVFRYLTKPIMKTTSEALQER